MSLCQLSSDLQLVVAQFLSSCDVAHLQEVARVFRRRFMVVKVVRRRDRARHLWCCKMKVRLRVRNPHIAKISWRVDHDLDLNGMGRVVSLRGLNVSSLTIMGKYVGGARGMRYKELRQLRIVGGHETSGRDREFVKTLIRRASSALNHLELLMMPDNRYIDAVTECTDLHTLTLRTRALRDLPKSFSNLVHLRHLDLAYCQIADVEALRGLQDVAHLNLSSTNVNSAVCDVIITMPNLTWLDLSGTNIDDVTGLAAAHGWDYLDISDTKCATVSPLQATRIGTLVANCRYGFSALEAVSEFQIKWDNPHTDHPVPIQNAKIRSLRMVFGCLRADDLKTMSNLRDLSLDNVSVRLSSLKPLPDLRLTSLAIVNCVMTIDMHSILKSAMGDQHCISDNTVGTYKSQKIDLREVTKRVDAFTAWKSQTSLRYLTIGPTDRARPAALQQMRNLYSLTIWGERKKIKAVGVMQALPWLRHLCTEPQ
jgi:hypothetical protein